MRYTLAVGNADVLPLVSVVVSNTVPANATYVADSTRLHGIPVRDDAAPKTVCPLDEGGLNIGGVAPYDTETVSFDVVVGQPPRGVYAVTDQATVRVGAGEQVIQAVTPIAGTLLQAWVDKPIAQIGETLAYSLATDYLGSQLLNDVVVTAAVPSGTTYVAGSASAGGAQSGDVITWALGSNTPSVSGYRAPAAYTVGSFTKTSGAAPASQTITHNLGVTPKALILWTDGKTNESFSSHYLFGYGFSDGVTSKSAAASSEDNVSPDNAARRIANKALTIVQYDQTLLAEADLAEWNSASLTLNWTTNNSVAYVVHYLIIGGADVSAKALSWQMPGSSGNTAVTGVGFRPDLLLHVHAGSGLTASPPAIGVHAGMGFGAMNAAGEQWAMATLVSDGATTSSTGRSQRTDAAILAVKMSDTTPGIAKQASFASMDADGFTVNFTVSTNPNAGQVISLALKGLDSKIGWFDKATAAAPAEQTITGAGFRPATILLHSFQDVAQPGAVVHARLGLGVSDGVSQGSSAFQAVSNVSTSSVDGIDKTSKVFIKLNNNTPAVDAEANLSSLNADGFALNWTTNDAVATQMLYLALSPTGVGDTLAAAPTLATTGGLITVTQVLTASQEIANVIPSALTITATNGVTATLLSGPAPASATVGITGTTFTWVYRATAAGNRGQLIFAGGATGAGASWPQAQTNSVIVHPPLTFQATVVGEPAAGGPIRMIAFIRDADGLLPSNASNAATTGLFGSIGDLVWEDRDGDAIQDGNEPGMGGVTVCATPVGGGAATCAVTDAAGHYGLANLPTGAYTITVDAGSLPAEVVFRTTPYPIVHTLTAGEAFLAADFGFRGLGAVIGDSLWYDADADGVQDAGEPGLGNISLALWLDNGDGVFNPTAGLDGDFFVDTTISDAAGAYRFDAPTAGTYFVDVTDDYGLLAGLAHTVGPQSVSDPTPAVTVALGQFYAAADFGYVRVPPTGHGVIGDLVWVDGNGDGRRQPEEPALIGVQVCATPAAGGAAICGVTDSNGRYLLAAPSGEYLVTPDTGPLGLIPASPSTLGVNLAAGMQALGVDFPFVSDGTPLGTIGGLVWQDLAVNDQPDGAYDPALEPGIPQVSIGLIKDSDGNGVWDSGEPYIATFTILDGTYIFPYLPGGAYLLRVTDSRRVLRYFAPTVGAEGGGAAGEQSKAQPYPVSLAAGGVDQSAAFGYRELEVFGAADPPAPGMIGDRVWLDVDGNGVYGAASGDEPLAGVTVGAYDESGAQVASATTGLDGVYLFTGLALADYTVRVTDEFGTLAGLLPTLEGAAGAGDVNQTQPYSVTLGLKTADFGADFGYARPATLAGIVFVDQNNNGSQDPSETFVLTDVSITLTDADGHPTSVSTVQTGVYTFAGLRPGVYQVSAQPVWYGFVLTSVGAVTLKVGVGGADSGPAFGYVAPTGVPLTEVALTPHAGAVTLTWRLTLWGQAAPEFHVWRSVGGASWKRLTTAGVGPTAHDGETASYRFEDAAVERGATYLYRLESTTGAVYGPWQVRVPTTEGVRSFLPLVGR